MGSKLVEIALHYRDLLEQAAVTTSADPQVAALKKQIRLALEAPDLKRADALLAKVQEIEDAAADRMALEAAATASQRAQIALTRLRYRDAARLFSKAAARVPPDYDQQRRDYLDRQADALYRQGDEKGDNAAIGEAILAYRDLVAQRPRECVPLDWAMTQNNLGNALSTLGARESGTARLKEAVAAYRDALLERTRERVPLHWATTQNNLGNALSTLGAREAGTARLKEAVAAYRDALLEYTRECVPLQWAMTQNNLGTALRTLGAREAGTARLKEAKSCIENAWHVYTDAGMDTYDGYFRKRLDGIKQLVDARRDEG